MASQTSPNIDSRSPSESLAMVKEEDSRYGAFSKPSSTKSAEGSSEMQIMSVIPLHLACSFSVTLEGNQCQLLRQVDVRKTHVPSQTLGTISSASSHSGRVCFLSMLFVPLFIPAAERHLSSMFRDVEGRSGGYDKRSRTIHKQNRNQATQYSLENVDMRFPNARTRARINTRSTDMWL